MPEKPAPSATKSGDDEGAKSRFGIGISPTRFVGKVLEAIVSIVKLILHRQKPNPNQIMFLAVVLGGILAVVTTILLAVLGKAEFLFATFGIFVLWILMLFRLLARLPGFVPIPPPPPSTEVEDLKKRIQLLEGELKAAEDLKKRIQLLEGELKAAGRYKALLQEVGKRCHFIYLRLVEAKNPYPDIVEDRTIMTITKDGDMEAERTTHLRATHTFLVLSHQFIGPPSLQSFWDLNLDATAVRDNGEIQPVIALPGLDSPDTASRKSVLLFFPPAVTLGTELKITLTWRWQGLWKPLVEDKLDTWRETARTSQRIRRLRWEFRPPPGFPPVILRNHGDGGGEFTYHPDGKNNWIYVWEATEVENGKQFFIEIDGRQPIG